MNKFDSREFRFLITQKCNYSCVFCHGEGLQSDKRDQLTPSDYQYLFGFGRQYLNWNTVTLSGGEPLVRADVVDIAERLHRDGAAISLITNGVLLGSKSEIGAYIKRVNVSVHSTKNDVYSSIVQRDNAFHKMKTSLVKFATINPNVQISLNAALVKGMNSDRTDVFDLINFARELNGSIKFIELFPPNDSGCVPISEVEKLLVDEGYKQIPTRTRKVNYSKSNTVVSVTKCVCAAALDKADPATYCRDNSDIFLAPDGRIKPCRFDRHEVDILDDVKARNSKSLSEKINPIVDLPNRKCVQFLKAIKPRAISPAPM